MWEGSIAGELLDVVEGGTCGIESKLTNLGKTILLNATNVQFDTHATRRRAATTKPEALRKQEEHMRTLPAGAARQRARSDLRRAQRRWRRKQAHAVDQGRRARSRQPAPHLQNSQGEDVYDRDQWAPIVSTYCASKYTDLQESAHVQEMRLQYYLTLASRMEAEGRTGPEFSVDVTFEARGRLKRGSASGEDQIVTEMLQELSTPTVHSIHDLFLERYSGDSGEPVEEWARIIQMFIPKESRPKRMTDYRGISLLSTLLKWYTNCLVILHERTAYAPQWSSLGTFGFRTGCACAQITAPLRNLHAKSWEWQEQFPIYTFIGDILMAFHFLRPAAVGRSMERRGTHPRLIAGFLREGRGLKMTPSFYNAPAIPEIDFNKCERMGGTDTIKKWNVVAEDIFQELQVHWSELGCGIQLNKRRYYNAAWADNWVLTASSLHMLRQMVQDLTWKMATKGLFWKQKSLQMMTPIIGAPDFLTFEMPFPADTVVAPAFVRLENVRGL